MPQPPITDEAEWAQYLDQLFADQPVGERGGAQPVATRREREEMEVAR